jgi:hypothetical protein
MLESFLWKNSFSFPLTQGVGVLSRESGSALAENALTYTSVVIGLNFIAQLPYAYKYIKFGKVSTSAYTKILHTS